eukprot:CAMPEP_0173319498 /NCGR_PEP_ID=MMETSP1143-20121109/28266_1 /TAXON_ID=483371 /ORGANISM="non described non described, Strain CCMP2298" /LENGTH=104 /DNA_ID=CAMNT_0014262901 /DNA_START=210 /DNA_END=524 /DNA_ORIENTATION=-
MQLPAHLLPPSSCPSPRHSVALAVPLCPQRAPAPTPQPPVLIVATLALVAAIRTVGRQLAVEGEAAAAGRVLAMCCSQKSQKRQASSDVSIPTGTRVCPPLRHL